MLNNQQKSDKELLAFIAANRPRTTDVARFLDIPLSKAKARLLAMKMARKISQKNENFPWVIYGTEELTVKTVPSASLDRVHTIVKGQPVEDDIVLEFIGKYSPLTADVANWLGVQFIYAAERLEALKQRGLIWRLRRKNPWRLRKADEAMPQTVSEDGAEEQVGRLNFVKDEGGRTIIQVLDTGFDKPLSDEELIAVIQATHT